MKTSRKVEYVNFPIVLLQGFMQNHKNCILDAFSYAFYRYAKERHLFDVKEMLRAATSFYRLNLPTDLDAISRGKMLYESIEPKSPSCGAKINILLEYLNEPKTESQRIELLAFMALNSIIGVQVFKKFTYQYLFSRMCGFEKMVEFSELDANIRKYASRYKRDRLSQVLATEWHVMIITDPNIRGVYASMKLSYLELWEVILKRSKKYKLKQVEKARADAKEQVKRKLGLD
ncbi:MAG: hypothetical protein KDC92_17745 [Bacteroidetes bacterium]|nr:hypothetical protein [Bacteroidota bacterium]